MFFYRNINTLKPFPEYLEYPEYLKYLEYDLIKVA